MHNYWHTVSNEEIRRTFPHDRFVAGLCHLTRYLLKLGSHDPWIWFVKHVLRLADLYLDVRTERGMELASYLTVHVSAVPEISAADLRDHLGPGWKEIVMLRKIAYGEIGPHQDNPPETHPLWLVRNFAQACTKNTSFKRTEGEAQVKELMTTGLRKKFLAAQLFPPYEDCCEDGDCRDAIYCVREFFFTTCVNCPALAGVPHAHLVPFDWPYWMEPELYDRHFLTKSAATRFVEKRFGDNKLCKAALERLYLSLDCTQLP